MDSEEHEAISASIPVASDNLSLVSLARSQRPEVFKDLVHHHSPTIRTATIQVMPLKEVTLVEDSLPMVPSLPDCISSPNPNFVPSPTSSPSSISIPPPYESKTASQSANETIVPTAGDPIDRKITNNDEKSDAETVQKVLKKVSSRDIPVLPVKKCKCVISSPSASENDSDSINIPIVKSKPVPKSSSHQSSCSHTSSTLPIPKTVIPSKEKKPAPPLKVVTKTVKLLPLPPDPKVLIFFAFVLKILNEILFLVRLLQDFLFRSQL